MCSSHSISIYAPKKVEKFLLVSSITMFCVCLYLLRNMYTCMFIFLSIVRELPPIYPDVRQKQRISIDVLPPEVKARFVSDPIIPIRTKTAKEFQYALSVYYACSLWLFLFELVCTKPHLTGLLCWNPEKTLKRQLSQVIGSMSMISTWPRSTPSWNSMLLLRFACSCSKCYQLVLP